MSSFSRVKIKCLGSIGETKPVLHCCESVNNKPIKLSVSVSVVQPIDCGQGCSCVSQSSNVTVCTLTRGTLVTRLTNKPEDSTRARTGKNSLARIRVPLYQQIL